MDIENILQELKDQRDRIESALTILGGSSGRGGRRRRKRLSAAVKKRISEAAKARWAKAKKAGRNQL